MKWIYRCPICLQWRSIRWEERAKKNLCHLNGAMYSIPGPIDQYESYVDTCTWPSEMEQVVVTLKGRICTVPGCSNPYETLDHRVPHSQNGTTSVENLYPMCRKHSESKGRSEYWLWLAVQP